MTKDWLEPMPRKLMEKMRLRPSPGAKEDVLPAPDLVDAIREHFRQRPRGGNDESKWREVAQTLLNDVPPDALPHWVVKRAEREDLKIRRALSFKSFMVQESESRRLGLLAPSWMLDQKLAAYRFIDELGIRRPVTDLKTYKLADVPISFPAVLKPRRSTGSKGCYLLYSDREIMHVKDGTRFQSVEAMLKHAGSLITPTSTRARPLPDRWFIEEMILESSEPVVPARDLKYFCFYGEVLFYLEVRRDSGKSRYSFRTSEHLPIKPGDWDYEYFEGEGSSSDELEEAKQLSLEIPHPFCRIDMLKSSDGLVFGEFTPRPGGYNRFSPKWDRKMGEAWARALHRIQCDMLESKEFTAFMRATRFLERVNDG